jgi:hypothetical protein
MAKTTNIVRRVKINRQRTPQEALDATGRRQYTLDLEVVNAMPRGDGEEAEVCFFKVGRFLSDDDLAREYELRGLVPDPYAQAAVNEADPAFADAYRNGTHWRDHDGSWYRATFVRWYSERLVYCARGGFDYWDDTWWFGGVRKSPS